MAGEHCMQASQPLEVFEELSTPVEDLLQPGFLDNWSWLEGESYPSGTTTINGSAVAAATGRQRQRELSEQHMQSQQLQSQQPQQPQQPCTYTSCQPQQHTHTHLHSQQLDNGLFDDSISPQFLRLQTPRGAEYDQEEEKEEREQSHRDICKIVEAPPTPGLSLLEQLHLDQPLMEVIANKHKRGYYRCTHCPETFSNIFEYASHMDEFGIKREFKCPFALCPWKVLGLPRRPDLRRHCAIQHKDHLPADLKEMLNLRDETYPTLQCPHQYCDKVFHRKDAYNRHISIVHEKMGSRFNKRMFQILSDCPFEKEADRQRYVRTRMKSRRSSTGGGQQQGGGAGRRARRHSIAIAGIR
ncbi:RME1 (YGR044C) [Zygosaccharomyces parabailii]|nr:RME1 (YGR044C) [Zygosaccharomyces parabailii]CDH12769.1 uncharacterized protein ZBAI_04555 [Zygosaccharomyces bailii ISA1307]